MLFFWFFFFFQAEDGIRDIGVTGVQTCALPICMSARMDEALIQMSAGELAAEIARGEVSAIRSEEHTSELQSRQYLVCRLLLEKKKKKQYCRCVHNKKKQKQ